MSIAVSAAFTSIAKASVEISAGLIPGDQELNSKRRLRILQSELEELSKPVLAPLNLDEIHRQRARLMRFYVDCYHLKDALKFEHIEHTQTIETQITKDSRLSMLADLANLHKHVEINRKWRSEKPISFGKFSGEGVHGSSGWRLKLKIEQDGETKDGIQVATSAMQAWAELIQSLNIKI